MPALKNIFFIGNFGPKHAASLPTAYQISCLQTKGFTVNYSPLFVKKDWIREIEIRIQTQKPFLIILEIHTNTRLYFFEYLKHIHNSHPKIPIAIIGEHVSEMYTQILSQYPYLIAVIGEGEKTLPELARKLSQRKSFHQIPGLGFTHKHAIMLTTPRPPLKNLDKLPFPQYELLMNENKTQVLIQTSRGCPFNCSFCGYLSINQKKVRFRSIKSILQEITYIAQAYPSIKRITIRDEDFFADPERVIALCDAIIQTPLTFEYSASGRFDNISPRIVKRLAAANFVDIGFGLESANKNIQVAINKKISLQQVIRIVSLFASTKIHIRIMLIVGLPGETNTTLRETALFIQKLQQIKYIYYFKDDIPIAKILPHTGLFNRMKAAQKISDTCWLALPHQIFYTLEHTEKTLQKMQTDLLTYISLDYFLTFKGIWRQWKILFFSPDKNRICTLILRRTWNKMTKRLNSRKPPKYE